MTSRSSTAGAIGSLAAAVLLPKCPMCVAALLSSVGVGAVSVEHATFLRPLAFALAITFALLVVWRRRHRSCHGR